MVWSKNRRMVFVRVLIKIALCKRKWHAFFSQMTPHLEYVFYCLCFVFVFFFKVRVKMTVLLENVFSFLLFRQRTFTFSVKMWCRPCIFSHAQINLHSDSLPGRHFLVNYFIKYSTWNVEIICFRSLQNDYTTNPKNKRFKSIIVQAEIVTCPKRLLGLAASSENVATTSHET